MAHGSMECAYQSSTARTEYSEIRNMADTTQRQDLQTGQEIFLERDKGSSAYIVQSGEIEIFKKVDGEEKVLGQVGRGGIIGEMSLIDNSPRMASARASQDTTVIVVTSEIFKQKLDKADPFLRALLNIMAEQIRSQKY